MEVVNSEGFHLGAPRAIRVNGHKYHRAYGFPEGYKEKSVAADRAKIVRMRPARARIAKFGDLWYVYSTESVF